MYVGRFFVSLNILPTYSPRMPMHISCTAPMKSITVMMVGYPATGSPQIITLEIIHSM